MRENNFSSTFTKIDILRLFNQSVTIYCKSSKKIFLDCLSTCARIHDADDKLVLIISSRWAAITYPPSRHTLSLPQLIIIFPPHSHQAVSWHELQVLLMLVCANVAPQATCDTWLLIFCGSFFMILAHTAACL